MAAQLYNKPEHRHTLIGNWQEEQKLLETTGTHRYKVGCKYSSASRQQGTGVAISTPTGHSAAAVGAERRSISSLFTSTG